MGPLGRPELFFICGPFELDRLSKRVGLAVIPSGRI